jgi:hypothetical protein
MKASAITTNPGTPISSIKPVFGRAVVVGTIVSWAAAANVRAAPTVAVAAAGVPTASAPAEAGSTVDVAVAIFTTEVFVGSGVDVVVGKMDAWKVAVKAVSMKALLAAPAVAAAMVASACWFALPP